jgi:pimeloyl-ACP methyl ester carboxylesterase
MSKTVLAPPWPRSEVVLNHRTLCVRHAEPTKLGLPTAIFIHGLGGSSLNWTDLMDAMRDEVDGYAVDLGGFGQSPPPRDGDMTPLGHARSVVELIDHLGGGPVHLFGNSLGGAVAVQIAARRPDLVRSLTMTSPALPTFSLGKGNMHLPVIAMPGVGEKLVEKFLNVPVEQRVQGSIDLCFANPSRVAPQRYEEAVSEAKAREHLPYANDAFLASLRGMMKTFLDRGPQRPWKLAAKITCPTLVIYGRKDSLIDPAAAHKVTKHFPNANVVVLPDSGHVAQTEHPELVKAAWDRFIAN